MKLKSGCIFWPQIYRGPKIESRLLDHDVKCDVAVIGGGISGALSAYHLTRAGIHCVMVERREVGQGSTAASTGLLQYEIDTPLVELADKIGRDRAVAAYQASIDSVREFEPLVAELDDGCGLIKRASLYLASQEKDTEKLRAECNARQSMRIGVRYLGRDELRETFKLSRPAALVSDLAFEVDPYRLTLQLIARSVQRGLEVFKHTNVMGYEWGDDGVMLHCPGEMRIEAKKIVFATGYETMDELPADLCRLTSTYALVGKPMESFDPWPGRCLIWEAARPYLYARTTEDGRVMVGGEDEAIVDAEKRDQLLESKTQTLRDRFVKLFPDMKIEADYAWAGTFAQTQDGLPFIGSLPQFPNAYFALGYGGNGITFSLLAAKIILELYWGKETEHSKLFGFDRSHLS